MSPVEVRELSDSLSDCLSLTLSLLLSLPRMHIPFFNSKSYKSSRSVCFRSMFECVWVWEWKCVCAREEKERESMNMLWREILCVRERVREVERVYGCIKEKEGERVYEIQRVYEFSYSLNFIFWVNRLNWNETDSVFWMSPWGDGKWNFPNLVKISTKFEWREHYSRREDVGPKRKCCSCAGS